MSSPSVYEPSKWLTKIVEQGRHEELLQKEGFYRRIYDLELRDQEEALSDLRSAPVSGELKTQKGV